MNLALLYIDPTTGGLGLQIILGFIVGGFVTLKLMWARLVSFVRGDKTSEDDASPDGNVPAETAGEDARQ